MKNYLSIPGIERYFHVELEDVEVYLLYIFKLEIIRTD